MLGTVRRESPLLSPSPPTSRGDRLLYDEEQPRALRYTGFTGTQDMTKGELVFFR